MKSENDASAASKKATSESMDGQWLTEARQTAVLQMQELVASVENDDDNVILKAGKKPAAGGDGPFKFEVKVEATKDEIKGTVTVTWTPGK